MNETSDLQIILALKGYTFSTPAYPDYVYKTLPRADADYPEKYRSRLIDSAPAVLFYAGEKALLGQPGIAVVGSRHLDEAGQERARFVGDACGMSGQVLYSGGAKRQREGLTAIIQFYLRRILTY